MDIVTAAGALFRRTPLVAAFTLAHAVFFSIIGIERGQTFVWIYVPALIASVGLVVFLDHYWGPIPVVLLWLLSIWAAMHLAGGLLPDPSGRKTILYGWWVIDGVLRWDQVVHGFGIAIATATFAFVARDSGKPLQWGFLLGQVLGLVNETAENIFAHFVENSNVGDWLNTASDIAWHVIGGLAALAWMSRRGIPGHVQVEEDAMEGEL